MRTLKINVSITSDMRDMIESCADVGYWAFVEHRSDGVYVIEHNDSQEESEWEKPVKLTEARRKRGYELLAKLCPKRFGEVVDTNGDAEVGDLWLQCAILGEIKYG